MTDDRRNELGQGDRRPIPDPTSLTTAQLLREIDGLKEITAAELKAFTVLMEERDRRYHERFDAAEEAVRAGMAAAKEAVTKAEIANEKRFDSVNEFREQLAAQAGAFLTRAEYTAKHEALNEKLDARNAALNEKLDIAISTLSNRIDGNSSRITEEVGTLRTAMSTQSGRSAGMNQSWVYLIGAVGLIATILTIYFALAGGR